MKIKRRVFKCLHPAVLQTIPILQNRTVDKFVNWKIDIKFPILL